MLRMFVRPFSPTKSRSPTSYLAGRCSEIAGQWCRLRMGGRGSTIINYIPNYVQGLVEALPCRLWAAAHKLSKGAWPGLDWSTR
jgi:hypothetical protein